MKVQWISGCQKKEKCAEKKVEYVKNAPNTQTRQQKEIPDVVWAGGGGGGCWGRTRHPDPIEIQQVKIAPNVDVHWVPIPTEGCNKGCIQNITFGDPITIQNIKLAQNVDGC